MTLDNAGWIAPEINRSISHATSRLETMVKSDILRPRLDSVSHPGAVYAELVEPVAQWLFSLAFAGGADCMVDLTDTPSKIYEVTSPNCGPRWKVFMPNQFSLQTVNPLVSPGNIWGPGGKFGLYGIILEAGQDSRGPQAELTFMLSAWTSKPESSEPYEITLVGFNTRGFPRASRLRGSIQGPGHESRPVEREMAVRYMLGLEPCDGFAAKGVGGGSVDDRLGFPFAEETLLGKMPLLIDYLRGCTEQLTRLNG